MRMYSLQRVNPYNCKQSRNKTTFPVAYYDGKQSRNKMAFPVAYSDWPSLSPYNKVCFLPFPPHGKELDNIWSGIRREIMLPSDPGVSLQGMLKAAHLGSYIRGSYKGQSSICLKDEMTILWHHKLSIWAP